MNPTHFGNQSLTLLRGCRFLITRRPGEFQGEYVQIEPSAFDPSGARQDPGLRQLLVA
jgi:hypothetical protein